MHVISGNHDIGFHYTMSAKLKNRFDHHFRTNSVQLIRIKGVNFVTINSVTMEGDYCQICSDAEQKLKSIGDRLCPKHSNCHSVERPILLTHFPLFRNSDSDCGHERDATPDSLKYLPFKQKWDCLSMNATQLILKTLRPRLVISGHTHYGCVSRHNDGLYEWTVPSFNYRNTHNPSLLLVKVSKYSHSVSKCVLINEFLLYFIDLSIILITLLVWIKVCVKHNVFALMSSLALIKKV